jgi:hypothetical protein
MESVNHYPRDLLFDIETLVSVAQPKSILILGPRPTGFLADYQQQCGLLNHPISIETVDKPDVKMQIKSTLQYDLGILLGGLERVDKSLGGQLISRLRDVQCRQFCLVTSLDKQPSAETWGLVDMLSFGLRSVATYEVEQQHIGLFKYNLKDYKKTPDWLNADNWANPEMWGKYWW